MGIHLREKKLGNGQVSFYLDIYHNKKRWYEFLDIHIAKSRPSQQDKEKRRLAVEIRAKRESELIVQDNGLVDKIKRKADFVRWFEQYINGKTVNKSNQATLKHLKKYTAEKPLPFNALTSESIKDFARYLLTKVGENTAADYIKKLSAALEEAVRQDIIPQNPVRKIARHERIKRTPIFRNTFTLDDLQMLANTPCEIEPQYKHAFLFSCFTGLRWSDVNPLRWSEVVVKRIESKEEWFLHFQQKKTDDIEYLPISAQAISILKNRRMETTENEQKSAYVFPLVKEANPESHVMNTKMNKALKKWAGAAGIDPKKIHFHSARHTFATNVLEHSAHADLWTVSKLLGHKSIGATQIYAHVRDTKKKAAISGLPMLTQPAEEAAS